MNIELYSKIKRRCHRIFVIDFCIFFRILKYKLLSTCNRISGKPIYNGPVLLNGLGMIIFEGKVNLGVNPSPQIYSSYIHLEARRINSIIKIGDGVWINNNACIISEGDGIEIGDNTLIGSGFIAYDTDFHDLNPFRRVGGNVNTERVIIKKNVFIGSNVSVLKGVSIGENSVIAHGSVVTKSIPDNVIAGGNPCRVIKPLNF